MPRLQSCLQRRSFVEGANQSLTEPEMKIDADGRKKPRFRVEFLDSYASLSVEELPDNCYSHLSGLQFLAGP